ncbi:MAG: DciA family protein [Melioribacteraceae bacterium]
MLKDDLRRKKIVSLTDVFTKDKSLSKLRLTISESEVVSEFENIFPNFTSSVKALTVKNSILYLSVENSVLKSELHLQRNLMIEKINKHFKRKIVLNIKFKSI